MQTVPQNIDKLTINNLFYYCEALIFTHPLVYKFLCGLIFMGHPVEYSQTDFSELFGKPEKFNDRKNLFLSLYGFVSCGVY